MMIAVELLDIRMLDMPEKREHQRAEAHHSHEEEDQGEADDIAGCGEREMGPHGCLLPMRMPAPWRECSSLWS
jgi:hypothetical protein